MSSNTIGDYIIDAPLGEGGMGSIYLGTSPHNGRKVAIKVIRSDLTERHVHRRFRQEIEVSKGFAHPFVIKVLDGGLLEDDTLYLVMEYLAGEPLSNLFKKRPATSKEATRILQHLCEALSYIHKRDIIHRDIKPQNILVVSDERTVLLDFGLALSYDHTRISATADRPGTWLTMAPEQMVSGDADERSDIYSLGVTMYWAVTGKVPYSNDELITIATGAPPKPPRPPEMLNPGIAKKLSSIILKAMEINPQERFQSADELLKELKIQQKTIDDEDEQDKVISSNTLHTVQQPGNPKKLLRKKIKMMAAVAVFILFLSTVFLYQRIWTTHAPNSRQNNLTSHSTSSLATMQDTILLQSTLPEKEVLIQLGKMAKDNLARAREFTGGEGSILKLPDLCDQAAALFYLHFLASEREMHRLAFAAMRDYIVLFGYDEFSYNPGYLPLRISQSAKLGEQRKEMLALFRRLLRASETPLERKTNHYGLLLALRNMLDIASEVFTPEEREKAITETLELCRNMEKQFIVAEDIQSFCALYIGTLQNRNNRHSREEGKEFYNKWIKQPINDVARIALYKKMGDLLGGHRLDMEKIPETELLQALTYKRKGLTIAFDKVPERIAEMLITTAKAYLDLNDKTGAFRLLEDTIEQYPQLNNDPWFVLQFSRLYASSAEFSMAIKYVEEILSDKSRIQQFSDKDIIRLTDRLKEYKEYNSLLDIDRLIGKKRTGQ